MDTHFMIDKSRLLPFYVLRCGHKPKQNHVIRSSGWTTYQIALCTKGEGKFIVRDQEHTVERGDLFLFAPRVPHEYYAASRSDWEIYYCVFDGESMNNMEKFLDLRGAGVYSLPDVQALADCEALFHQALHTFSVFGSNSGIEASIILYRILSMLPRCTMRMPAVSLLQQNEHYKRLAPALNYMRNHFREDVSLDDICNVIGVSKSYLCRIFKKTYGITPAQYLISLRLTAAKKLLISTDIKTKVLSCEVGFNDASYFCSVFKKSEGMTPEEFRKLHED